MEVTERWLNKLIDMEEVMYQGMILGPMIVMLTSFYSINLVSVMFAGHIGDLQLAAANLAHSWAVITGFSFMFGLSAVVEPLCRQAYRTRTYRMLQIHLQISCIILFFFSIAIALLWWYSDAILVHVFHQDYDIAKEAGVYLKFLIPGLFGYGVLQNVMRFLKAQSILDPMFVFLLASLVIHIAIIAYALVHWTGLGFKGASLATSISIWISLLMFSLYVFFSNSFNHITWNYGFSFEPFHHLVTNLKLALPSAAMACTCEIVVVVVDDVHRYIHSLECCGFEILVLLAGLMPNPVTTISTIAMSLNIQAIAHMLSSGLSLAVSTRATNKS
ncbi:protein DETOXIFICATION 18 [Capsicum annuum]